MAMDGRGYSDLFRNSSEDMFMKTVMDSPVGMPVPTMEEMLGLKNFSQNFRVDSEELFKIWLTNGESPASGPASMGQRPRHVSRGILNEPTSLSGWHNGNVYRRKGTNNINPQHQPEQDVSSDMNHHHHLSCTGKGIRILPLMNQLHCLAVSDSCGEMRRDAYQIPNKRVHILINGVDEDEFHVNAELGPQFRSKIGIPENARLVVFAVAANYGINISKHQGKYYGQG